MKFRNYIWDFDGTLFDSYPHIAACMEQVMEEEGLSCDHYGLWQHLLVNFAVGREYAGISSEAYRRFLEYQHRTGEAEIAPVIVPYDGVREVLSAIVEDGGRNYLYTHRNKTALEYLRKFGMYEYFADFVTSEEGFPNKPSPDAVLAIIERNGLAAEECVMIGDRLIDGMSGINAGIAGVLITAACDAAKNGEFDGYDGIELELKLAWDLGGVSRCTMDYIVRDIAEFSREMGIRL